VFRIAVLLLGLLILLGCSNPKSTIISNDPAKWDTDLKASMGQLSEQDKALVSGYLARVKVGEAFGATGIPPGTTIQDAIKQQQQWQDEQAAKKAEEERLKQELAQRKVEAQKRFDEALTVVLVSKGFHQANTAKFEFSSYHTYTFGFQNKTDKAMLGVKGTAKFADLFGDEIKSIKVSYDKPIPVGTSASWDAQSDFNQFSANDIKLRDTPQERINFTFIPETILFTDGTRLEALPSQ